MHKIRENLFTKTGWEIIEKDYDKEGAINSGSLFLLGNGYLGFRGNFAEDSKEDYTGCFVTDTWDKADGKWEELCNVPNALITKVFVDDELISLKNGKNEKYKRSLNLKSAIFKAEYSKKTTKNKLISIKEEKFASLKNIHVIPMKFSINSDKDAEVKIVTGIDGDVWNLNGNHLKKLHPVYENDMLLMNAVTYEKQQKIVVLEKILIQIEEFDENIIIGEKTAFRELIFKIPKDKTVSLYKFMIVIHSEDIDDPYKEAIKISEEIPDYDSLKKSNKNLWKEKWDKYDIQINGSVLDQIGIRFNTYQSVIATPTHKPLPIGARGMSCQAYQGAAFWDEEIYNLPMYLYTDPKICRNILDYRYITINGARKKAEKLGYEGAFYAWISGKTGEELCPDFFFIDVNTGRPIRNHFNAWQIHISPDIAYTVWLYYKVTNDWDFILNHGAEITLEVSRFLSSHAVYKMRKKRYEFMKLQGPDEYHENVENNAFTNYQAFFTFKITKLIIERMKKDYREKWEELKKKINLKDWEIELWNDMLEKIYLPKPNNKGVIEQFDGYFKLEDIVPAEKIKERLIREDEYFGWPVGITVFTQVIKQADVIQLLILHPELFKKSIIQKNYDYYEPRTLHFSSLSPSSYSIVAARVGYIEEAYEKFQKSLFIDLRNTNEPISGGTFIGGIHTASAGVAWQMIIKGFVGFRVEESGNLYFDPSLPKEWNEISFYLNIRENKYRIFLNHSHIKIEILEKKNDLPKILYNEITYSLKEKITEITL